MLSCPTLDARSVSLPASPLWLASRRNIGQSSAGPSDVGTHDAIVTRRGTVAKVAAAIRSRMKNPLQRSSGWRSRVSVPPSSIRITTRVASGSVDHVDDTTVTVLQLLGAPIDLDQAVGGVARRLQREDPPALEVGRAVVHQADRPLAGGTDQVGEQQRSVALHRVGQAVDPAHLEDVSADAPIGVVGIAGHEHRHQPQQAEQRREDGHAGQNRRHCPCHRRAEVAVEHARQCARSGLEGHSRRA